MPVQTAPGASLEELYNPMLMPPDLRGAHAAPDKAVDAAFSPKFLKTEGERQKVLLESYERMVGEKEG